MTDIEKLIKLLEHAESFSLEAYGKSPNLSECSLNIQYLRACILQAIDNAKALRERLAQQEQERREWQGLTNEEVGALTVFDGLHHVEIPILANFVWAVEAKIKEKNT